MNDEIDLPTLQSLTIGSWSLQGDYRDNRKTISSEPYNYKNTLRMRSDNEWDNELNRSSFIDWDERRLEQLHVYRIRDIGEYENGNDWRTDIPLLSSSGLSFTGNGFKYTYSLHSTSKPCSLFWFFGAFGLAYGTRIPKVTQTKSSNTISGLSR